MLPVFALSFPGHCPLTLAIALALNGVPAFGETIVADGAGGRSVEDAGTLTDNASANSSLVVDREASRAGRAARGGTVKLEVPARAKATETAPLPNRASAAQMIYIDPVTGEFTSSPPQEAQILRQFQPIPEENTSFEGLEVVTHPDGSLSVDLQGRFQSHVFATIDGAGKIMVSHQPSTESRGVPAPAPSDPLKP